MAKKAVKKSKTVNRAQPKAARRKAQGRGPKAQRRARKYVYFFGAGKADGDRSMRELLGGKGANLAEMTNAGLPVPAGFTISTAACTIYYKEKRRIPAGIDDEMIANLRKLEKASGAQVGATTHPRVVSVRSGSNFSMA